MLLITYQNQVVLLQVLSPSYQEWVNYPLRYGLLSLKFCAGARTLLSLNDHRGTAFFFSTKHVRLMGHPHLVLNG